MPLAVRLHCSDLVRLAAAAALCLVASSSRVIPINGCCSMIRGNQKPPRQDIDLRVTTLATCMPKPMLKTMLRMYE